MRKNYIKSGDIILIPINEGQCGVAKIIYLSSYFKNMILLSIYPLISSFSSEKIELPIGIFDELLIYTGNQKIKKEEWRKLHNVPVSEEEKKLSKRIVGGDVWIEDNCIKTATEEELKSIKRMDVDGIKLVENKIIDYLSSVNLL